MKVVIDTNIILDAVLSRQPFKDAAEEIFILSATNKIQAFITANSATDLFYIANKEYHDKEKTKALMNNLFAVFHICDVTASDCLTALKSDMSDFEDAVLSASADRIMAKYIITRNLSDFQKSTVSAIEPKEFLKLQNID